METPQKYKLLQHNLLNAAGMYSDYHNYWSELCELTERYDESEELYQFQSWMGEDCSMLSNKAYRLLSASEIAFRDLYDLAANELYHTFIDICSQDEETQKAILDFHITEPHMSKDQFSDMMESWEYRYVQEEALESFVRIVQEHYGQKNN